MSEESKMSRRQLVATLGAGAAAAAVPAAMAQTQFKNMPQMPPKKWSVTVQRFNPSDMNKVDEFTLPVDCPDPEHAASAVLSNLIAWTTKTQGTTALPIAFRCTAVTERVGS